MSKKSNIKTRLAKISKQRGLSRSIVLQETVGDNLAEPDNSLSQQATDLAGSLTGPEALSTSAEHMAEYGR